MRIPSIGCFAVLCLGCSTLLAYQFGGQGPTSAATVTAAEKRLAAFEGDVLTTVPERTWKIVEADTTKMLLKDVELVDRKFRGTVRLQLAPGAHTTQIGELAGGWRLLSNETRALFASPGGPLLFSSGTGNLEQPSASDFFRILIERTPKEQRPAPELLDYLSSPAANQDITFSRSSTDIYRTVLGKTSDEVESRSKAIVQLLDAAMYQSTRRELLMAAQVSLAKAKAHLVEQQRLEAELKALRERADDADPISPELLTHLQAQQITIGIESDGLVAELKAGDELLKGSSDLEREAVRTRQINTKLEMSRQRAKLERINALLKAAQEQANRRRETTKLDREIASAAAKVADEVGRVTTLAKLIDLLAPPAVDDAISIAPIEWVTR
jgi:hypothetical protein